MDWEEEGIVLSARKHGETSLILQILTRGHGRHAGLVRGGARKSSRGVYQPGNIVSARWRARLSEHLGVMQGELVAALAAEFLDYPDRLAGLSSACAVAETSLPERQTHAAVFDAFRALLDALATGVAWRAVYVRWEIGLLEHLGFGLDLRCCAVTGVTDTLAYVSPKTGRAVSRAAGAAYQDRLLSLPDFLIGGRAAGPDDISAGLRLTGHFLERHVFAPQTMRMPAARERLVDRLARLDPISSGKRGL